MQEKYNEMSKIKSEHSKLADALSDSQKRTLREFDEKIVQLEQEEAVLVKDHADLLQKVQTQRTENEITQSKNRRLEADITLHNRKIEIMENNIEAVVMENSDQFEHLQDLISENNRNANKMIEDLRNVQKQHFEMENVNEALEQRIDQLKGQNDLSI